MYVENVSYHIEKSNTSIGFYFESSFLQQSGALSAIFQIVNIHFWPWLLTRCSTVNDRFARNFFKLIENNKLKEMGAKLSPRVLSRRLSSLILIFYMFQLTKCTCNWYSGCKFKRLCLCEDCVISSHYALSFVFSNGNIERRFPFFKWNAFNTVRIF